MKAMHAAVGQLNMTPARLWIDGHYFVPHSSIPHTCVVGGDAKVACIAAASILAKTYRDALMITYHRRYPGYAWDVNKGYPTAMHRRLIEQLGLSPLHRRSFRIQTKQLILDFPF
jgi:ribonuclease HII